jgi:hypothetical protein
VFTQLLNNLTLGFMVVDSVARSAGISHHPTPPTPNHQHPQPTTRLFTLVPQLPHQVGFMVVDSIARSAGIDMRKLEKSAAVGRGELHGRKVILAKPVTFMNNSGESVAALARFYKVDCVLGVCVCVCVCMCCYGATR